MSRDIRDLLGAAIGDEPPLGIDREVVLEAGRKRLRRRRLIQSGSVVAAVVVAAAGAVTLTGLPQDAGPGPSMPPAASQTEPRQKEEAPPDVSTTTTEPPASAPVSTTTRSPDVPGMLTDQLYKVLSPRDVNDVDTGLPAFRENTPGYYFYRADVRRPTGDGTLEVGVTFDHPRDTARCSDSPAQMVGCTTQVVDGVTVAYGDYEYGEGARRIVAIAVLPGRVLATAVATNAPTWHDGKTSPPRGSPVFTKAELARLLVQAGFRAG